MSQDPVTRAQQRENEDPEEAVRPMPVAALLVAAGMVVWAVVYILSTEPLTLSQFGDQRTRAELSGPVAAAGGAVDGKALYAAQCAACHEAGLVGAPKFGDAGAWGPRLGQGFEALVNSALKGKGNMGAQGGGDHSDLEIARAVAHMANAGGGKFEEPKAPEGAASAAN